jgi:hypothetical protein
MQTLEPHHSAAARPAHVAAPIGSEEAAQALRNGPRRARRRRLQLRPAPALAGQAFARPVPGAPHSAPQRPTRLKTTAQRFFTADYLALNATPLALFNPHSAPVGP